MTLPISILDLMPIPDGGNGAQAIHNTLALAKQAEALGYYRYWLAEHHNFVGLAAVAPEVLIGVIARETQRIRVGSGGILLPNYAPLKVAETFRTLEAITPGRVDLGIGRAPNQDKRTALALRGSEAALSAADDIGQLLAELEGFAEVAPSAYPEGHPLRDLIASPEGVPFPPIWLLGSGQLSGKLAAERGRGFAAAYHFSPLESEKAIRTYKANFQPSTYLAQPHAIASVGVICAETDALAEELKLASDLMTLRRQRGERSAPPTIEEARAYAFTAEELEKLRPFAPVYGSPARVQQRLTEIAAQLDADELMIVTTISDHALRRRSYELVADAFDLTGSRRAATNGKVPQPPQKSIQAETLKEQVGLPGAPLIVDVRSAQEYAEGHVPGALHIPLEQLPLQLVQLPHDKPIVTYCMMRHPGSSRGEKAAALLTAHGFDAAVLAGGLPAWQQHAEPVLTV